MSAFGDPTSTFYLKFRTDCKELIARTSLSERLSCNRGDANWMFILSYLYHDDGTQKMLDIMCRIFPSFSGLITTYNLPGMRLADKWFALTIKYPELNLPDRGDGLKDEDGKLVSTYPKFEAFRARLLKYVPELQQYVV